MSKVAEEPITTDMRGWAEFKRGPDGMLYSVRYLLTDSELAGLQRAGLIGEVFEVVGVQTAAAQLTAKYEKEAMLADGGYLQ